MSFLADLPSLGNFLKFKPSAQHYIPKYVCDHETAPPNGSVKTDETNILIRSLNKKKKNAPPPDVPMKPPDNENHNKEKGKRPVADNHEERPAANGTDLRLKRLRTSGPPSTTSSTTPITQESLENMTKTQLVTMCKQHSLSTVGNKEVLIERILKSLK